MATAEISTVILPRSPQGEFNNEPFTDFSRHENAHAMKEALTRVGDMLGHEYELVIGGERLRTAGKIESRNPGPAGAGRRRPPEGGRGARRESGAGRAARLCELAICSCRRARLAAAERGADHSRAQVRVLRVAHL